MNQESQDFPELNLPALKRHAERWLKKFSEAPITKILLYHYSFDFEWEMSERFGKGKGLPYKYAIVFEVNAENKAASMTPKKFMERDRKIIGRRWESLEPYERLLAATEHGLRPSERKYMAFIGTGFTDVYKAHVKDIDPYRQEWDFRVEFKDEEILEEYLAKKFKNGESYEKFEDDEPYVLVAKADPDDFLRGLRVEYVNDYEVDIGERGKASKTYTCQFMGFRDKNTKEWEFFIQTLQKEPSIISLPGRHTREYERAYKLLQRLNDKLVSFLKKEFGIFPPKGYKTYKKYGNIGLVFKFDDLFKGKTRFDFDQKSDQELLKAIQFLAKGWQDEESTSQLVEAYKAAKERGLGKEAEKIIDPRTTPEEIQKIFEEAQAKGPTVLE